MSKDMLYKIESGAPQSQNKQVKFITKNSHTKDNLVLPIIKATSFVKINEVNKRTFSTVSGVPHFVREEKNRYAPNFNSWLAGYFEARGHISISKPNSNSNNLSLSITFHLKDLPLAEKLKDILGHG